MELDETNPLDGPEITTTEPSETPVAEVETAIEDDGPIDLDAPEEEQADEPEVEAEPEADPFIDLEYDGKAYKVPAELKDAFLRQADYTRKTQEVARITKEAEAKAARLDEVIRVSDDEMKARAVLINLDSELEQYQNIDWQKWMNEDPIEAQAQYMRAQQLEKSRDQVTKYQSELVQQRTQFAEQETVNRLRETADFAKKSIPGWTPDLDAKITDFAVRELGYPVDTLKRSYNPQIYKTLYLAHLGQQTLSRQQSAKPAPPQIAPTRTVSAKSSPAITKDPAEMNMDEYVVWANSRKR